MCFSEGVKQEGSGVRRGLEEIITHIKPGGSGLSRKSAPMDVNPFSGTTTVHPVYRTGKEKPKKFSMIAGDHSNCAKTKQGRINFN